MKTRLVVAASAIVLGCPALGDAQILLQNDGFSAGQEVGFQAGFVSGEEGAARLDLPEAGTYKINKVQLLFGGDTATKTVTLKIYSESGNDAPGSELYAANYDLIGSNTDLTEIDLNSENIMVTDDIRVSIAFLHAGVPSIARDTDGSIDVSKNFIYAGDPFYSWFKSSLFGLEGDWVIRAEVTKQVEGTPDAGPVTPDAGPVTPDAGPGAPDAAAGTPDAGPGPGSPDAGTGALCSLNSDCQNGSYCGDDGLCTQDCRSAVDCASNQVCDLVGRCVDEEGGGGGCGVGGPPAGVAFLLLCALAALGRRRRRD